MMNVTVTAPSAAGFLTVWPKGISQPNASNLNFAAGQTVPNLVISKIGAEGEISYYSGGAKVHVLIDLLGYISSQTPRTELLNRVDDNDSSFEELTTPVQGVSRVNSLTYSSYQCSASNVMGRVQPRTPMENPRNTLSFDDLRSKAGSKVRFRILGDGVELVNQTLSFGQALNVTANVTNVLRLRFEILKANPTNSPCFYYPTFATVTLGRSLSRRRTVHHTQENLKCSQHHHQTERHSPECCSSTCCSSSASRSPAVTGPGRSWWAKDGQAPRASVSASSSACLVC